MIISSSAETQVNTYTFRTQDCQQAVALSDGGWVVTWRSDRQDGSLSGIYQQAYNADGTTRGAESRVNTETVGEQNHAQISALADGGWVVTWVASQQNTSSAEIHQRAFWINEAPIVQTIAAQTATEARPFKFTYAANTFVDPNAMDKITITATLANGDPLPSWLVFNAATRTFSGTPGYTNIGAIGIRVTATDMEGETAVSSFTLTVEKETPPAKTIKGTSDDDTLVGGSQKDALYGYGGDDIYIADNADDYVEEKSGEGTDLVKASVDSTLGAHVENLKLTGTASIDGTGNELANTITGNAASNTLSGGAGDDKLLGNDGDDALFGGSGNDVLAGGNGGDALYGGAGSDALSGGSGRDKLSGGAGADKLHGGGGADMFIFTSLKDSTVAAAGRDTIFDFSRKEGDRIDLKGIDASTTAGGNQAFSFIGADTFSKTAGELRYERKDGGTYVYGDVNGDGKADFSIRIDSAIDFTKADFLL